MEYMSRPAIQLQFYVLTGDLPPRKAAWQDTTFANNKYTRAFRDQLERARQGQIVELRFFGGLSIEETASVLRVSPGTVMRDWTFARAWLRNEMTRA